MKLPWRSADNKPRRRSPDLEVDCELAQQIVNGDREALTRLIDRHLWSVYKYLERRIGPGNEQLISQVISATFDESLRRLRPYARGTASTPMRLWLLRLANRQLARMKAKPTTVDTAEGPELASVRAAMNTLPARHQAALALALFEELPPDEIAAALGVGPARAMRIVRGALHRIRTKLQAEGAET